MCSRSTPGSPHGKRAPRARDADDPTTDPTGYTRPSCRGAPVSPKNLTFLIVFLVSLVLDQASKFWIYTTLAPHHRSGDAIVLIPHFLEFIHAQNPGAAFSLLADFEYRYIVFVGFAFVALGFVAHYQRRLDPGDRLRAFAFACIASGAVGNAIDRVHKRTVTDFIRVFGDFEPVRSFLLEWFGTIDYPTFNVADIALFVGIAILLIWGEAEPEPAEATASPAAPEGG